MVAAERWVRLRAAGVWCVVSAGVVAIAAVTLPALSPSTLRGPGFADQVVAGCAAATLVATFWLWVLATDVAVGVLRGGHAVRRAGRVRMLLLAACGVAVIASVAGPATADDRGPVAPLDLSGLPLPDRATGGPGDHLGDRADHRADRPSRGDQVRVRPGDSLWSIAESRLGPRATVPEIATLWRRIHARNVTVIGPDPDLIHPGQLLELPPTKSDRGGRP